MTKTRFNQVGSIQKTISRFFVIFTLALAACYSLLILIYSWVIEDNIFNRLVMNEASFIKQLYEESGEISTPRASYMKLHLGWDSLPAEVVSQFKHKPNQIEFQLQSGETMHIHVLLLGGEEHILAANVGQFEVSRDYLPHITGYLLIILFGLSLIALFIAWTVASKITSPVKKLASEVSVVAEGGLAKGFAADYPNNEIGLLANTIESSVLKLQAALERESHFTKDVSHELRTPITVLKNLHSQLKPGQELQGEEVRQLGDAVLALEQMTQTLLALARNESSSLVELELVEIIEFCLLNHHGLNHTEKGQQLEIIPDWSETCLVNGNQQLIEILFDNIISNAVNYASDSKLLIRLRQGALIFKNTFEQMPDENVLESGVKGNQSHGIGQGLSLIQRICQRFNWHMSIEQSDNKFCLMIKMSSAPSQNLDAS